MKITVKSHLTKTVTQWWIPPIEYFNCINFGYGDMSINGSYPSSSFKTLYDSLCFGFTFSLTQFNATS